jgi:heptaprenylglyceryl phosphate synthase
MDKSREHELKLIQMLNSGGSATHQQKQYAFQSMPNSGNTQYIENGSIANYSQKWHGSGTFAHYMLSQPEMPHASFGPFTPSSNMPSTSAQNICDGKVYYKL